MDTDRSARAAAGLHARALTVFGFAEQVMADTASVTRAGGLDVFEGMETTVVGNSASMVDVVPSDRATVTDALLAAASGRSTDRIAVTHGFLGTICACC